MRQHATGSAPAIPTFDFYGDAATWPTSALVHSERLIERSARHHWRIGAHRHDNLTQVFLLSSGSGSGYFDAVSYALSAPCVALIPARCVHAFEWHRGSEGYALSIATTLVSEIRRQLDTHPAAFTEAAVIDTSADARLIETLFDTIHLEYVSEHAMKEMALDGLIRTLAIWVARHGEEPAAGAEHANRASRHFQRFGALVESHHREQWNVSDYAAELGITAPHLNAVCRSVGGTPASRLIHDRLALAARRELAYTDKSIGGVAASLGFEEASYFTRFIKRELGMTPTAYRRRCGTVTG